MTEKKLWHGFKYESFMFDDKDAIIVFPNEAESESLAVSPSARRNL